MIDREIEGQESGRTMCRGFQNNTAIKIYSILEAVAIYVIQNIHVSLVLPYINVELVEGLFSSDTINILQEFGGGRIIQVGMTLGYPARNAVIPEYTPARLYLAIVSVRPLL